MTTQPLLLRRLVLVERLDDEVVLLEAEDTLLRRPRSFLAAGAREGDVVDLATGEVDVEATAVRRKALEELQAKLKAASPQKPGGFDLE